MADEHQKHIQLLLTAELQFRLASAVRLATTRKVQPLDLPIEWTHGRHRVTYNEIALRMDQADYASHFLYRSATYLMAVTMKDAIRAVIPDPKRSPDAHISSAYQIARLIRNAFAHAPLAPVWSIDPDCRNITFAVQDIIALDTSGLHGTLSTGATTAAHSLFSASRSSFGLQFLAINPRRPRPFRRRKRKFNSKET